MWVLKFSKEKLMGKTEETSQKFPKRKGRKLKSVETAQNLLNHYQRLMNTEKSKIK